MSNILYLYTDGGSRSNPGPAGIGFVIKNEAGETLRTGKKFLGKATNNEAEYQGLIIGLQEACHLGGSVVKAFLDSQLVVNQLNGVYKIKKAHLASLAIKIRALENNFDRVTYTHVSRDKNKEADQLANEAMDKGMRC